MHPQGKVARVHRVDGVFGQGGFHVHHHLFHRHLARGSLRRHGPFLLHLAVLIDPALAARFGRGRRVLQGCREGQLDVGDNAHVRALILPDHLFRRVDMDQGLIPRRQGIANRTLLVQPGADGDDQIRPGNGIAGVVFGTAEIAQIVGVIVGKGRQAPVGGDHRNLKGLREANQFFPRAGVFRARSGHDDRVLGRGDALDQVLDQTGLGVSANHRIGLPPGECPPLRRACLAAATPPPDPDGRCGRCERPGS